MVLRIDDTDVDRNTEASLNSIYDGLNWLGLTWDEFYRQSERLDLHRKLAFELHLTRQSAAGQLGYAAAVARRLPATFAALAAGQVHPVHLRIIEDETSILSDQDAARADTVLAGAAPGLTFGELRAAAHKLILKLDPEAARKRKEAARSEAHVRRFREASGNAGMVARELPSDEVLASWQHVEQRALDLRAAGSCQVQPMHRTHTTSFDATVLEARAGAVTRLKVDVLDDVDEAVGWAAAP